MRLAPFVVPLLLTSGAHADDLRNLAMSALVGTNYTKSSPIFRDGKLEGCTVEFGALLQDWVYGQGTFVLVGGFFGILQIDGKAGVGLKVVVNDMGEADNTHTPNAPSRAYLISSNLESSLPSVVSTSPTEIPGGVFVVANMAPSSNIILDAIRDQKITIAFNKGTGATDIRLDLDLSVIELQADHTPLHGTKTTDEFVTCLSKLLEGK